MGQAKRGVCQLVYTDPQTHKVTKSCEVVFSKKHQHGVQPRERDWQECWDDLTARLDTTRGAIEAHTEEVTFSQR